MRFVCLGNSFKEGGRCLAGIELNHDNSPVMLNGRPKWVRPICRTEHDEIPTNLVVHIKPLDIVEITPTEVPEQLGYQSENIYFATHSIHVRGSYDVTELDEMCESPRVLFVNRGKAIPADQIGTLNHSLILISVNQFQIVERTFDNDPRARVRLVFSYNDHQYDFPVTDPVFLHRYQNNPDFLEGVEEIYVSVSVGINWNGWYYKLIALILPKEEFVEGNDNENIIADEPVDDLPF